MGKFFPKIRNFRNLQLLKAILHKVQMLLMRPVNPGSATQYFTKIAQGTEGLPVAYCIAQRRWCIL